jgi:hypothetical protein
MLTLAEGFQIAGFALVVLGLSLWSVALACVVGGVTLFVCGGLAASRR